MASKDQKGRPCIFNYTTALHQKMRTDSKNTSEQRHHKKVSNNDEATEAIGEQEAGDEKQRRDKMRQHTKATRRQR